MLRKITKRITINITPPIVKIFSKRRTSNQRSDHWLLTTLHPRLIRIIIPHAIDLFYNKLDLAVIFIIQIIILFQTAAEKESNRLIDPCSQSIFIFFDDIITIVARLAVDQFHQDLSL